MIFSPSTTADPQPPKEPPRSLSELGFGKPVDGLAELLARNPADILVLGSHGHRTVADFIHGTTVDAVRHRLDIPVLVAPAAVPFPDDHSGTG